MPTRKATKAAHREYISGPIWRERRNRFMRRRFNCENCGLPRWLSALVYDQDLHVHHVSYARSGDGKELDADLKALCARCHELETFGKSSMPDIPTVNCNVCDKLIYDVYGCVCEQCSKSPAEWLLFALSNIWGSTEEPLEDRRDNALLEISHALCQLAPDLVKSAIDEHKYWEERACQSR